MDFPLKSMKKKSIGKILLDVSLHFPKLFTWHDLPCSLPALWSAFPLAFFPRHQCSHSSVRRSPASLHTAVNSSRICLYWTWSTTEQSKPEISNLFLCAAVLKLQFYLEGTCPSEGKLFCGWCADLYKGRIKALLFFSQVQKNVHGESSLGNSSKRTPGHKILYSMGQHMQWKPGFSSRH